MNFDRLRYVSERSEIGELNEMLLGVTIPEKPGSFKKFCSLIGKKSITEFNYRYSDQKKAHVFVGIKLSNGIKDKNQILSNLKTNKYKAFDYYADHIYKRRNSEFDVKTAGTPRMFNVDKTKTSEKDFVAPRTKI